MSSQLALASLLSTLNPAQLTAMIETRAVAHPESLRDALDLAGALLKPESIQRALHAAPRDLLALLSGQTDAVPEGAYLSGLILPSEQTAIDSAAVRMPEVSAVLDDLLQQHEIAADALLAPSMVGVSGSAKQSLSEESERVAAERAFDAVGLAGQLLRDSERHPLTLRQHDALSAVSAKRIAAECAREPEEIVTFVRVLLGANLLERKTGAVADADRIQQWRELPLPQRYVALTEEWLHNSDAVVRSVMHAWASTPDAPPEHILKQLFPLSTEDTVKKLAEFTADATQLGLLVDGHLSPAGTLLVNGDRDAAIASLSTAFPATVTQVYVQPDLSVIAPGPLNPEIEAKLLQFSELESAGLASSFRISAKTLEASLSDDLNEGDIRAFLEEVSLTGIPQPLDYLLTEATRRHGSIVVRDTPPTSASATSVDSEVSAIAQTWIVCQDASAAAQLRVDRALTPLGLSPNGERLLSSLRASAQVVDALRSAGYPVTTELRNRAVAEKHDSEPSAPATDLRGELALRIVEVASHEQSGGSHERLLELAVRQKQRVRVVMQQLNQQEREFVLRPVGLRNGRLRGIDEIAQVERTLPVADLIVVEHLSA